MLQKDTNVWISETSVKVLPASFNIYVPYKTITYFCDVYTGDAANDEN